MQRTAVICEPLHCYRAEQPELLQGAQAVVQDQDFCRHQRQCGPDPSVDGVDRDAGAEVPADEIVILLVIVNAGSPAASATVLLSRSVGVVG